MEPSGHHGDHRALLRPAEPVAASDAKVDAIVVPSARTAPYLLEAAGLAEQLNCVLVVLCSRMAKQQQIVTYIEDNVVVVDLVAVDVPDSKALRLPPLETSAVLVDTPFERLTDTSAKRNAGLALSRMVGWTNIMFLDDDITVPDPLDVRRAVAELHDHDGVGLSIGGYPDNSVVCHAHRQTGGFQATFVGGGALAVPAGRIDSFFPETYNEDWFFLLDDDGLRPATLRGAAKQAPYDPFADPERARREEFGDVIAEGIFSLLDQKRKIQDADDIYWDSFLHQRKSLIDDILLRLQTCEIDPQQRKQMIVALKAARGRLLLITPKRCVAYLEAWRADLVTWRRYLDELPNGLSVQEALSYLRLRGRFTVRWNRTGPRPREPRLRDARRRLEEAAKRDSTRRTHLPRLIESSPAVN